MIKTTSNMGGYLFVSFWGLKYFLKNISEINVLIKLEIFKTINIKTI